MLTDGGSRSHINGGYRLSERMRGEKGVKGGVGMRALQAARGREGVTVRLHHLTPTPHFVAAPPSTLCENHMKHSRRQGII